MSLNVVKEEIRKKLRSMALFILSMGLDPRKLFLLRHFLHYYAQRKKWLRLGGKIDATYMILGDYEDFAGKSSGHYYHQDLLVANLIFQRSPRRHVDVGSRVDGFVAHVASFRKIDVIDIREMPKSEHENINFMQLDLMGDSNQSVAKSTDSLSCLHAIEHFGLGRYNDPIDINGHITGICNLVAMLELHGRLYISFPIGLKDEVVFNAHRIFHPNSILSYPVIKKYMVLKRFDFVDDEGFLRQKAKISDAVGSIKYGCGIYTFEKVK